MTPRKACYLVVAVCIAGILTLTHIVRSNPSPLKGIPEWMLLWYLGLGALGILAILIAQRFR